MFRALDVVANSLGVGKSRGAGAGARNDANPVKSRFKGRLWVELKAAGARLVQGIADGEGIEATTRTRPGLNGEVWPQVEAGAHQGC